MIGLTWKEGFKKTKGEMKMSLTEQEIDYDGLWIEICEQRIREDEWTNKKQTCVCGYHEGEFERAELTDEERMHLKELVEKLREGKRILKRMKKRIEEIEGDYFHHGPQVLIGLKE